MPQARLDVNKSNNNITNSNNESGFTGMLMNTCMVDCVHRRGFYCTKKEESVAVDCREEGVRCCWERFYCDYFEKKK